jgi:hypothetical protein
MRATRVLTFLSGISLVAGCLSKGDTIISQGAAGQSGEGGQSAGGSVGEGGQSGGPGGAQAGGQGGSGQGSMGQGGDPQGGSAGQGGTGTPGDNICTQTPDACNDAATRDFCGRCALDTICATPLDAEPNCGGCNRTCGGKSCIPALGSAGCATKELLSLPTKDPHHDELSPPFQLNGNSVYGLFVDPNTAATTLRRYSDAGSSSTVMTAKDFAALDGDGGNIFLLDGTGVVRVGDDNTQATTKQLSPRMNGAPSASIANIAVGNQVVVWSESFMDGSSVQMCVYAINRGTGTNLSTAAPLDGCADKAILASTGDYVHGLAVAPDDWVAVGTFNRLEVIDPSKGTRLKPPLGKVPYVCWGDIAVSTEHVFFYGSQQDPKTTPSFHAAGCTLYRTRRDATQAEPEALLDGGPKGFDTPRMRFSGGNLYFHFQRESPSSPFTIMRVPANITAPVLPGLVTVVADPTYRVSNFSISGAAMVFQGDKGGGQYSIRMAPLD